ncbi:DUF6934 family protein [Dyadobacter chenhuakuii]|uniref:Uncharacterized protein n=1 Tax=Dyadobacter chenhuakuii TaxID=2909339 RepID=A0ABY4XFX5_9BACT|nr:hypothetical protein [Dyadobacter chenhuakuii]MCF2495282.1 hypothetical protein [Dyadobacter chenhuakuii]USJ29322.1 hypothetical protein NFI80_15715 [Dyadobacter chenhuakuii]
MKHNKYISRANDSFLLYHFTSKGPKGSIQKSVIYSKTAVENIYNLAFGDYNPISDEINDLSISNNGDSVRVLATVAATLYTFTEKYPEAWITATGSTKARTRLYRMGIANNLAEIIEEFAIFGYNCKGHWEQFVVGEDYEVFLLTRKETYTSWKEAN